MFGFNEETKKKIEDWVMENEEKIRMGVSMMDLIPKVEITLIFLTLTIYKCGAIIRADIKINSPVKGDPK